jgi:CRP-like cAMP-binding protein
LEDLRLLEIPLFSGLDRINLAKLIPELERVNYQPGEILFKQGDPGDSLFIIVDGRARIFLADQKKESGKSQSWGQKNVLEKWHSSLANSDLQTSRQSLNYPF